MKKNKEEYLKRFGIFASLMLGLIAIFAIFISPEAFADGSGILATIPIWGSIKLNTFKELSDEEVVRLTPEELGAYTADRTECRVKELILESKEGTVSKDGLDKRIKTLNKEIKEMSNDEMKALKKSVDKLVEDLKTANDALLTQGGELKALKELGGKGEDKKPISFKAAVRAAIMEKSDVLLKEINDDYGKRLSMKDFFDNHPTSPKLTIKAAVDMLQSNIVQSEVNLVRLTELDPNRVGIPLTIYPHVLDWMPRKGIKKANMSILVVYNYEDGADTKTEGTASSKSSFLLKTVEYKAFYLATYFTLSDETLDDLDEVMDEIAITAPDKILDKIDTKILGTTGDGSTDIKGLYATGNHTDFATVTYTNTVAGANIIDLIAKAKLQCEANKYHPNVVSMHPTDIDNMAALKNTDEDSVTDRRVRWDALGVPTFVMGMRIIPSTEQTVNTLAVIDQKQLIIGNRKDMTMEIGYNGTDLTEGQKTVVIKIRLAFGIRDITGVIYSDDIATDVAAIDSGI